MNAVGTSRIDRIHVGLVRRVTVLSTVLWLAAALAALAANRPLSVGIVLGGSAMLGLLLLYRWLAERMLRPGGGQWYRPLFWAVWLLKWPVIGGVFYLASRSGLASAVGMIVGVSVVPTAAVAVVVWALLADLWRGRAPTGGES